MQSHFLDEFEALSIADRIYNEALTKTFTVYAEAGGRTSSHEDISITINPPQTMIVTTLTHDLSAPILELKYSGTNSVVEHSFDTSTFTSIEQWNKI